MQPALTATWHYQGLEIFFAVCCSGGWGGGAARPLQALSGSLGAEQTQTVADIKAQHKRSCAPEGDGE